MPKPIITIFKGVNSLEIYRDTNLSNPRMSTANIGKFVAWHSYTWFPDKGNEFAEMSDFIKFMQTKGDELIVVPVFIYENAELNISVDKIKGSNYTIGFIYIDAKEAEGMFSGFNRWKEDTIERLKEEIKLYNWYLTYEVYRYIIKDWDGKILEAAGGFYGPYETKLVPFGKDRLKHFVDKQDAEMGVNAVKIEYA